MKVLQAGALTLAALGLAYGGYGFYRQQQTCDLMQGQAVAMLTEVSSDWSPLSLSKHLDRNAYEERVATYLPMLDSAVSLGKLIHCPPMELDQSVSRFGDKHWALTGRCQFASGKATVTLLFPRGETTPITDFFILR